MSCPRSDTVIYGHVNDDDDDDEYFAKSLKVIENSTVRKLEWVFPFAFHNNYGPIFIISEIKQDIDRKSHFFFILPCIRRPPLGGPRRNIAITFGVEKLEWRGYPTVKKVGGLAASTDRRTYRDSIDRAAR